VIFGDDEPEDAWHPDDSLDELADNLRRRIELLDGEPTDEWGQGSLAERLAEVERRLDRRQRAGPLTDRQRLRAIDLIEDLYFVRERLHRGE
jgi:hypothetical protein